MTPPARTPKQRKQDALKRLEVLGAVTGAGRTSRRTSALMSKLNTNNIS